MDASLLDEHWISTDNMYAFPQPQTPAVDIMYSVLAILHSQLGRPSSETRTWTIWACIKIVVASEMAG